MKKVYIKVPKFIIMLGLIDQYGSMTAYLFNNIIVDAKQQVVKGVILGNCVFGIDGKLVGKLLHNIFYTTTGEIAARMHLKDKQEIIRKNISDFSRQAWSILDKIKTVAAPWIDPSHKWSPLPLQDILEK